MPAASTSSHPRRGTVMAHPSHVRFSVDQAIRAWSQESIVKTEESFAPFWLGLFPVAKLLCYFLELFNFFNGL